MLVLKVVICINLGTVSEDVLRDGRKAFEQGLPVPGEDNAIDTTAWGAVPTKQKCGFGI